MSNRPKRNPRALYRRWFALGVFVFCALAALIAAVRLGGQNRELRAVENELEQLERETQNLEMCIRQAYNLNSIGQRAELLGMQQPEEEQLRVIRLPQLPGDTTQYSVSNVTSADQSEE
ncbi:MAG: hypothetical protein IJ074_04505 [Clostridia bacterium]|nr:hypothetical protein [Clostridia bacterium]